MTATVQSTGTLSIIIYASSPLDTHSPRPTALYFDFPDSPRNRHYAHITGHGFQRYTPAEKRLPHNHPLFRGSVLVTERITVESTQSLLGELARVEGCGDGRWRCQHWIDDALRRASALGYITKEQHWRAVDGMMDLVLEDLVLEDLVLEDSGEVERGEEEEGFVLL